jgi:hypothetical protein
MTMIRRFSLLGGKAGFARRVTSILLMAVVAVGVCAAQTNPSVFGTDPSSIAAGSGTFSLVVNGSNFQAGAVVSWNGTFLQTNFQNSAQILATVPSNLIATAGFATIFVTNLNGLRSNGVGFTIVSSPVTITTVSLPAGGVGATYAASLAATGGVPPYTWSATSVLPAGLALNANGSITGTPTTSGIYNVAVRVVDAQQNSAAQSFTLTITGSGVSIVTPSTLPSGSTGQPYTQTLTVTGGTGPYTWSSATGLPGGLSLNPATGVIAGTPTAAGTFTFTVQVTDANRLTGTQNFTLIINSSPLTITTVPPLFSGIVGTAYSQTFSASGGTLPYQWTILSGNAGGLTLDPNSGTLQGTPQSAGAFTFTVQVSDARRAAVSQSFSVTIAAPALTIVTAASLPSGAVGVSYTQQFSVVGGTAPYTWSLVSGSVPGLAFDASRVTLSGTPTTPGSFTFTLQSRDAAGLSASRAFALTISPAQLSIASPTQLPDGTLGASYTYQMTAAGGIPPYTWSANGLPDGLSIDPNTGVIAGVVNAAGPPPFAVRVIDSARTSATNQFRINVALPTVPSIALSGLPSTVLPAQQFGLQLALGSTFPVAISGQAILSFAPEVGGTDGTIQFSTGGTTASFTIPAGSTTATFPAPLAVQTGTVAGTITVSLRLNAGGQDVTPSPPPAISAHIDQAAPVIQSATVTRSGSGLTIQVTGFSTAREVTQATFTFNAASGQTLQSTASQITIAVDTLFGSWFQNAANSAYGSQFVLMQPFSIQGDPNAVLPQTVTLTNRRGTVTASITP